jgi:hypothetical protein
MNNPLSLTDPTGLDFYLTCTSNKDNASTCQGGHVGTTDDKGKFTATVITSAQLQDPKSGVTGTVTGGGVQITTSSGTYGAQFINGTPAATLQGSGALANFTFNITGQNPGNMLRGSWQFNGTAAQAQQWMKDHGAWSYPLDVINPFHPNTQQFPAYEMMKLIVAVILALIVVATRHGDGSLLRRYLGFVLVSLGALFWAGTFDALGPGRNVVSDTALYKRVILWSVIGVLMSLAGLITSLWCRQKLLKVSSMLVGAAAAIMCAVNILVPY